MTSPDWLHHQAEVHPRRLALATQEGQWSFTQLDEEAGRLAGSLMDYGIKPKDRVAYHLKAGAGQVALIHALTRIGAVLVPLNTRLTDAELAPILVNAEPQLIIHDERRLEWPPFLPHISLRTIQSHAPSQLTKRGLFDLETLHALVYTSGTTGTPKGVELTLGNQWWSAVGFALNAGTQPEDRWLNVMPLFHVGGLTILFRSVIHGSAVFLKPQFDPEPTYQTLQDEKITLASLVPTMLKRLLDLPQNAPSSLRLVLLGGAPASPQLIEEAKQRGYPVASTYGMTETCSQIATSEVGADLVPSLAHSNLPTRIRIVKDGEDCRADEPGEIWISGPTIAKGYWRNPSATQDAFSGEWLKTGDFGTLSQDGYLKVTDRIKNIIIRGGENIFPREVEDALRLIPAIGDVSVFGVPDPQWGERVAAAIVCKEPILLAEIATFLSKHLASYKIPSVYFRMESIPRNPGGKVLRNRLLQLTATTPQWVDAP